MRPRPWLLIALCCAAPATAGSAPAAGLPNGKALYVTHCAQCHGRDGTARPDYARKGALDLNDADWQKERTDTQIREVIAKGSPGTLMEAYAAKLSPAEIDAVVAHLRTLKPRS